MNKYIDHTNLKPTATHEDIVKLCEEAMKYQFRAVCVHPCRVTLAASEVDVKIATVISFPLGANDVNTKMDEVTKMVAAGANEIDVVWNLGHFKDRKYLLVERELSTIVTMANYCCIDMIKIIVETCYLTAEELITAHQIVKDSGADCIKTSTGFGSDGAEVKTVELWKKMGGLFIKASGGIKTFHDARMFIEAGADFLGTSSGVQIMQEESIANHNFPDDSFPVS